MGLALLQAALLLLLGGLLTMYANRSETMDRFGLQEADVRAVGIVIVVLGVVHLVLALGLRSGRPLAQSLYGVLATIQTGIAVYTLVAVRDVRLGSIWALVLAVGVLWLLYGTEETQEYFHR